MERLAWTDERLDDLARRMDEGFARVDRDIRELRTEVTAELKEMRATMNRVGVGLIVGLVGVIVTSFSGAA